jgi:hypothetical protein
MSIIFSVAVLFILVVIVINITPIFMYTILIVYTVWFNVMSSIYGMIDKLRSYRY